MKILVTGGAGFIGSHLTDALLEEGHQVRVLDSLDPQVHGQSQAWPAYLSRDAELIQGDVRDGELVAKALQGIEVVYHQAAAVGVGQSMYEIQRYVAVNSLGAAVLLEAVVAGQTQVERLVVASSMSLYGEGAYIDADGEAAFPQLRPDAQLERREWEHHDAQGRELRPVPTPESKPASPTSVYAVTKRDHEELFLAVGSAYRIPTVALRYFNIYGPRQSLSNPYTGVAAIFSSRLRNGKSPKIFEDGNQSRDFIHVSDIVRANLLAMERAEVDYDVVNVGTGTPTSILQVADALRAALRVDVAPEIVQQFRAGDIRHCYADITKIQQRLGFQPKMSLQDGIADLVAWAQKTEAVDRLDQAIQELADRGLAQ